MTFATYYIIFTGFFYGIAGKPADVSPDGIRLPPPKDTGLLIPQLFWVGY